MAVAYDAVSQSHASGNTSVSQASFSWTHTPAGTPRGILVFTYNTKSTSDNATSVTYGGVSMTAVSGGRAVANGTHPVDCKAWFLGASIPTGAQTVTVNRTNNTDEMWAVAFSVTAAADTSVHTAGIVLSQQSVPDNGCTLSEQSVTDGQSSGTNNSVRFAGFNGRGSSISNTTTTFPLNDVLYPGASSTMAASNDLTNEVIGAVRETTAGIGARNIGFTFNGNGVIFNTQTLAAVHLAIKEGTGGGGATAYPANLLALFIAQEARNERATYGSLGGTFGQLRF